MKRNAVIQMSSILVCSSTLASCAWMSVYVEAPQVEIEKVSTRTAEVYSANFWRNGDQLSLRGEVVSKPVTKSPLRGHLDIEISGPDPTDQTCLTTSARLGARHVRKPYSVHLAALPPPGSTVRIWHHVAAIHATCQSSPSSTNSATETRSSA